MRGKILRPERLVDEFPGADKYAKILRAPVLRTCCWTVVGLWSGGRLPRLTVDGRGSARKMRSFGWTRVSSAN